MDWGFKNKHQEWWPSSLQCIHIGHLVFSSFRFYRAPEILLGLPFCEKVAMWSLGCVMAELYLGWPLYPGKSEFEQVCYICETQGLPHSHLLNITTKTNLFFQDQHGAPAWELKPSMQGPNGEIDEHCKHTFSSLDQLCSEDVAAEITDCHYMVELIKRMLALISHQRITPDAVLRHLFITLTHLDSPDTQSYYDLSLQELQKALIQTSSIGHRVKFYNPKAEVIIHYTTHKIFYWLLCCVMLIRWHCDLTWHCFVCSPLIAYSLNICNLMC